MDRLRIIFNITILAGALIGGGSVMLSYFGNPINSGICMSCFLENLAGALQLHDEIRMSYLRPELIGFILGSFIIAQKTGQFNVTGGSSPFVRFALGFFLIVGCAVFIGCPIKMILRFCAGDLTAVSAIFGMIFGIWIGTRYIKSGMFLDRPKRMPKINGYIAPGLGFLLLIFMFMKPQFLMEGLSGPAASRAPQAIALGVGLLIGGFGQRSGLCITGGFRNFFLFKETTLLFGVLSVFVSAFLVSIITGQFNFGVNGQPASHLSFGWSFLAMALVGLGSVIIDGCPFRQFIKAGQGDVDAGITSLGMITGAALVISWAMRSTSAGPMFGGKIAVLFGLIFCLVVILSYRDVVKVR